jgi:hypothetical protein
VNIFNDSKRNKRSTIREQYHTERVALHYVNDERKSDKYEVHIKQLFLDEYELFSRYYSEGKWKYSQY